MTAGSRTAFAAVERRRPPAPSPTVQVRDLCRRFGDLLALDHVNLEVTAGRVHALVGPNGAGKTTLLRVLAGLVEPSGGTALLQGHPLRGIDDREGRRNVALIPSGDRSFYLRLSGLENLLFFARLHGLPRRTAAARSRQALERVGLAEAARQRVGTYSHGMQKRLSVARGLLSEPVLLLVDEATHDLDPDGAARVRQLVRDVARDGVAVLWATQRLEELRGFADQVAVLAAGRVRFAGTVAQLSARSPGRRYLLRVRAARSQDSVAAEVTAVVGPWGEVLAPGSGDPEHFLLALRDEAVIGEVICALTAAGLPVLGCQEERSEIEQAFLLLTQSDRR